MAEESAAEMLTRSSDGDHSPKKVVGRRRPPSKASGAIGKRDAIAWSRAIDRPFVRRGVYRFETHQEADAWMWAMITRPRKY